MKKQSFQFAAARRGGNEEWHSSKIIKQKGCNMNKTQTFVALCAAVLVQMAWAVDFPAADADGTVTLTSAGTYSASIPSGTKKLVVNAGGEAVLSAASTGFTGPVVIKSGSTLKVTNKDAVSKASSVTVESGGTLHGNFPGTGQWTQYFTMPIYIAGAGNGGIGAFKFTNTGSASNADSAVKTLILTADATIDCSSRWGISNGNGAGTIDLQGHTLTRIGGDNFMFVSANLTPGTFIHKAGKITFQTNGGKYQANETCNPTNCVLQLETGSTLEFWSCGYEVPYKVIFNGGKLSIGSGSGVPPYNTFSGPVEFRKGGIYMQPGATKNLSVGFTGSLNVTTNTFEFNAGSMSAGYQCSAYFGGPISGTGNIKAVNGARFFFQGNSVGTVRPVMQNGEMEFNATNACFGMFRCANGGSAWGAFHQVGGTIGVNRWDSPRVGEAGSSFGAYTFDQGRLVVSNTFYLGEKENSRGIFLQKGGSFELHRDLSKDDNSSSYYKVGGKNAIAAFVQVGGTNDTRMNTSQVKHFSIGEGGATNDMVFVVSGKDTLFETDKFYVGNTNLTRAVMTLSDGAEFKAKRFVVEEKRPADSKVVLNVNGGAIYPLFGYGWNALDYDSANFKKRTPDKVVVFEKGAIMDTSECSNGSTGFAESYCPLQFIAPEGQGIATISLPASLGTYHGPVPVVIRGPAGSYGASAYADYDFSAKKLSKIVVTSSGCNYDATTKIYILTPDGKGLVECPTYTLTGPQTGGGLVKRGAQQLCLYGTQSYAGGTTVEEGLLSFEAGAFPEGTAVTVAKGARISFGNKSPTVSVLSGSGEIINASAVTVTQALRLDPGAILADGFVPMAMASTDLSFGTDATVEVTVSEEQRTAFDGRRPVAVLTARSISGTPKLKVNGAEDGDWLIVNTGTALKFGPRHGMSIIVR